MISEYNDMKDNNKTPINFDSYLAFNLIDVFSTNLYKYGESIYSIMRLTCHLFYDNLPKRGYGLTLDDIDIPTLKNVNPVAFQYCSKSQLSMLLRQVDEDTFWDYVKKGNRLPDDIIEILIDSPFIPNIVNAIKMPQVLEDMVPSNLYNKGLALSKIIKDRHKCSKYMGYIIDISYDILCENTEKICEYLSDRESYEYTVICTFTRYCNLDQYERLISKESFLDQDVIYYFAKIFFEIMGKFGKLPIHGIYRQNNMSEILPFAIKYNNYELINDYLYYLNNQPVVMCQKDFNELANDLFLLSCYLIEQSRIFCLSQLIINYTSKQSFGSIQCFMKAAVYYQNPVIMRMIGDIFYDDVIAYTDLLLNDINNMEYIDNNGGWPAKRNKYVIILHSITTRKVQDISCIMPLLLVIFEYMESSPDAAEVYHMIYFLNNNEKLNAGLNVQGFPFIQEQYNKFYS